MPISEKGHARNVENFQRLISFVTAYGATYNPTNATIALAALNTKLTAGNAGLDDVSAMLIPYKFAVNEREIAFAPLSKLTRASSMLTPRRELMRKTSPMPRLLRVKFKANGRHRKLYTQK